MKSFSLVLFAAMFVAQFASAADLSSQGGNAVGGSACWDKDPASILVVVFNDDGGTQTLKIVNASGAPTGHDGTLANVSAPITATVKQDTSGKFVSLDGKFTYDLSKRTVTGPGIKGGKNMGICPLDALQIPGNSQLF